MLSPGAERATAFSTARIDGEYSAERAVTRASWRWRARRGVTGCAWRGAARHRDEVASLAFSRRLCHCSSGSGNDLPEWHPFDPRRPFDIAIGGRDRVSTPSRSRPPFFNLAGVVLDAPWRIRFLRPRLVRRGLFLLEIAVREIFARSQQICMPSTVSRCARAYVGAMANGRQYGNGALIAPDARIDDGLLDVVIVDDRSPWAVLRHAPKLFRGRLADVPGVTMSVATRIEIASTERLIYHVDGEPCMGGSSISARIRPGALRVRVGNLCA